MSIEQSHDKIKDPARLDEIARLRLHEEGVDSILQRYVEEASQEFKLPIGLVSIVLDEAQKFAADTGLEGWLAEVKGSPVEWSFCANSVRTNQPFVVEEAESHALVKDNPLVTEDGIRCYAGAPLVSSKGYTVGNFCVIGTEARKFTQAEISRLKDYAERAMAQIEARAAE